MDIHQTIKVLRKRLGLKQKDLARAVGVSQGMVSQWKTGRSAPELTRIPLLAATFGVSERELLEGLLAPEAAPNASQPTSALSPAVNTSYFKTLDQALAHAASLESIIYKAQPSTTVPLDTLRNAPADGFEVAEPKGGNVEVPASVLEAHPAAQAVLVEGDYINRVAPAGTIVVFDPDLPPSNGRIVIVETEDHKPLIRRWHKGNTTVTLYADSYQPHPDIILAGDEPTRMVGTVVKVIVPDSLL